MHHPDKYGAADELATVTETKLEAAKEGTQLEGHKKKGDELDACTLPTEDTKAAEEGAQLEGQEKNSDECSSAY